MRLDRILTLVKILRRKILKLNLDQELLILIKRSYFGESTQPLGPFCLWHCFCSGRFGDRRNWDGYHWDLSSLDWAMGWGWATYWVSNEQLYHYWSALQLNLELSQPSGLGHCHYWTQSWSQKTKYRIFQFSLYLVDDNFWLKEINVFKIQGPVRCKVYWPQSCPIPRTGSCAGRKETALQCCW